MGYWDDPTRPMESYSDAEEDRMPNGHTPRGHARIQRAFKFLLRALLRREEEERKRLESDDMPGLQSEKLTDEESTRSTAEALKHLNHPMTVEAKRHAQEENANDEDQGE
jgi:hypothetical protein